MTIYDDTLTDTIDTTSPSTSLMDAVDSISSSISTTSPSSTQVEFSTTSSNNIVFVDIVPMPAIGIIVNELITIIHNLDLDEYTTLIDNLVLNSSLSSNVITSDSIENSLLILESVILSFKNVILDTASFSETISPFLNNLIKLFESIILSSSVSDKAILIKILSETISVLDITYHGINKSITDTIVLSELITELSVLISELIDSLILDDTLTNSYIHMVSLSSSFEMSEEYLHSLTGITNISDMFLIKLPDLLDSSTYLAYTFSPETKGVTTYTNFNFTKAARFNNKYIFSNEEGLFELGGVTDDNALITSYIETAGLSFGTSDRKIVPTFYLGYSSDGDSILRVRLDGKGTFHYKLRKHSNDLGTRKIDIGKGLEGRYFQFEIITDADTFNLESMEFLPMIIKRKL